MDSFKLVFSKPVLQGTVFDVTHDRAEHPSGAAIDREIVQNAPSTVILAQRGDEVLLIRQYRLPMRKKLWEAPAGRCDPGEEPLDAAQRELAEETGYRAENWTSLTSFYSAPGFASEHMTAFLAEDLREGESSPEPYELIETRWVAWAEALRMVRDGEIADAKTISALLYADRFSPRRSG